MSESGVVGGTLDSLCLEIVSDEKSFLKVCWVG